MIVVPDSCTDDTEAIVRALGRRRERVDARNVGLARAHGAERALALGARWLAFTDADTTVADDWLVQQLDCCADAVCGVIGCVRLVAACRRRARALRAHPIPTRTATAPYPRREPGRVGAGVSGARAAFSARSGRGRGARRGAARDGRDDRMERVAARRDERAHGFPREEGGRRDAGGREQALLHRRAKGAAWSALPPDDRRATKLTASAGRSANRYRAGCSRSLTSMRRTEMRRQQGACARIAVELGERRPM